MDVLQPLLATLGQAPANPEDGGLDIVALVLLAGVVLFFGWLVVAVIRRKLTSAKGRLGDLTESEEEAAETARLWAEARRRTAEEEEGEEAAAAATEEHGDLQEEMLERSRKRREERGQHPAVFPVSGPPEEEVEEGEEPEPPVPEPAVPMAPPAPPVPQVPALPTPSPSPAPPPPMPVAAAPAPAVVETPRSLEDGLRKTREGVFARLGRLFGKAALGEAEVEEIEEILFTADIGVRTSQKLIDFVQKELGAKERSDTRLLYAALQKRILQMLTVGAPLQDPATHKPWVILVIGVNGTGKTTTIGKLATLHRRAGRKVILAAGDTFRAAAAEQLEIWGQRAGAQVIRGQDAGDPGSVVYDAISAAKHQGADVVIADTAGRLHTKVNLVEELKKVHRVCGKAQEGAPHEVFLVLDATTGQNAISQAKEFHGALSVTGMVLTKLDGTAKGGVIIGICDTFGIPVRYIGIGEQVDDLRPFEPEPFVRALFS